MLLCKGKDETSRVANYEFDEANGKYLITFINGDDKQYIYNANNVTVLQPQPYDVRGKYLFYGGRPLTDFEEIILFSDDKHRFLYVVKNDKQDFSAPENHFTISETAEISAEGKNVFDYLRTLASFTAANGDAEEDKSFLAKVYANIEFIHPESVLASFLNRTPIYKREAPTEEVIFPFRFNLSQKTALEQALIHSISIIEGPPGTGKTQTILNILANLTTVMNKTVGVVSFNNEAVKNVKDKLDKQQYGFLVADLGRSQKRKEFFQNLPTIDVAGWDDDVQLTILQHRVKELNVTLTKLLEDNNRLAQLKQELAAYQLEQQYFDVFFAKQCLQELKRIPAYARSSGKLVGYLANIMLEKRLSSRSQFLHKLKMLIKYREYRFGAPKTDEINTTLQLQKQFYHLKIAELNNECRTLSENLKKYSFKQLQDEHQQISERIFKKKLFTSHGSLKKAEFSDSTYKNKFKEFYKYYPIVISTNHSIRNSIPPDYLFDYIIIDEASQVDLLSGVLALSCCKNLIIVGDLKQLPQIVDNNLQDKVADRNIAEEFDYFKHNILSSFLSLYKDCIPKVQLREHYRCHPQIIQFCNQKYYDGELIPFTNAECCNVPLMLYKTSKGNHMRSFTNAADRGRYNQRELDVIKAEVLQNVDLASNDIGVATPYRKQADKAAAYLPNRIKSDTIHKFQGRENDVIIMSTVLDNSRDAKKALGFVDEACLVNVAVSRAQKQFILVTDDTLFQENGHHVRELFRYIQYNTLDKHIIDSQIVSVFDLLYKNYSEKLKSLSQRVLYHSKFKSEDIIESILKELFLEPAYSHYGIAKNLLLRNMLKDLSRLSVAESSFVNSGASVDFIIYTKQDKKCVFAIEVDGFAFHANNPKQLERDRLKDSIFKKHDIPLLRLPTNGSGEITKIRAKLNELYSI